ncbi:acetate kinase [uncultured Phascolarctobacterium sp.]|uniref:acetate/propionate family kinase n=1 Tax=Phascolarctobacterium sp. TaxID=2049039 RepID=UPI0025FAF84A|nr:acetate kinase [uncultured Phascolarctobacterium sp.]
MKILVINCGSSSIKFQLLEMTSEKLLAKGQIERIGMDGSLLKIRGKHEYVIEIKRTIKDHRTGINLILESLTDANYGVIQSLQEIDCVGHRVVHGGEKFKEAVVITGEVLKTISSCITIAPLHNPVNLEGIKICLELFPDMQQVAVFDTAFHQTIPETAYLYGLPYELYIKYGIRRYGFHGISHQYVTHKVAQKMGRKVEDLKIITCHLGNGASIDAVKNGRSIDTSMGFTPLEGLVMGTRSGEIDPAIIPFIMEQEDMTGRQVYRYLNNKSGILGLSGLSSDFRDLESAARVGDRRAQLAIDVFAYQVKKYIGSYVVTMGGVDAIVFTAGLGENSPYMREQICDGLEVIGAKLDLEKNKVQGKNTKISRTDSNVELWTVLTNEELMIARETQRLYEVH